MAIKDAPQIGLMDEVIEDADLVRLLGEREDAKGELQPYRDRFAALDKQAKAAIALLELEDGTYRVGRFKVTLREASERHIEFERQNTRQVLIRPAKDDD